MRSPWNLLSKLTSRRKAPQDGGAETESKPVTKVIETGNFETPEILPALLDQKTSESQNTVDLQSSTSTLPFVAQHAPVVALSGTADEALKNDALEDVLSISPLVAGATDEPKATIKIKGKASARRSNKADVSLLSDKELATTAHEGVSAAPTPLPSPFEEAASVDEEIKRLRTQLAHKLVLQNAQLKKMLERFDRS